MFAAAVAGRPKDMPHRGADVKRNADEVPQNPFELGSAPHTCRNLFTAMYFIAMVMCTRVMLNISNRDSFS